MAATMHPDAGEPRQEYDATVKTLAGRISALEQAFARSREDAAASRKSEAAAKAETDFVRRDEFRQFKWIGAFALTAVMAGFGVLYQQVADLRVGMERIHTDLLREIGTLRKDMEGEHDSLRAEMKREHDALRTDLRTEMKQEHDAIRQEIGDVRREVGDARREIGDLRDEVGHVRERVVRIETLLSEAPERR